MEGAEPLEPPASDGSATGFDPRSCNRFSASIPPTLRAVDSVEATDALMLAAILPG
jgi:hypothetical protein